MAQQALKHIVKKVVSASAVVAVTDDCKDEMDEIAYLVFGAGTITPKYDSSGTIVSATTPPPGQPLQVHSNPRTNAAIIDLGRRMASNASIQKGVIETINQSGWLMYGAGSMCLPLEDWDEPGVIEHEEIEPGAVPLSDDEDWGEDFDDGTDLKTEEPLARSYPHMSITGGAPVRSNSVPLLSAHKITTADVESPDFSPTISPTPSYTSSMSDESASIETLPSSSSLTDSMREHRRQRAERARKQPGIFQSFAGWIQSFFMPIPTSTSTPTSMSDATPSTATASEEKHGVAHHEEGHAVSDEKCVVSTTSTSSSSSTTTSTSTSTSNTSYNNMVSAALGVATVIIVLLATKRVLPCMFTKLVAYLRR